MRRSLVIALLVVFALTWLAGPRLALLLTAVVNALVLIHFAVATARRVVLTGAALAGPPAPPPPANPLPLTVLVPCRNEQAALPETLRAWDAVDYPRELLRVMFIDDASSDQTPALLADFARARPWAQVVTRTGPAEGKGAALAAGLAAAAPSEAVAVFDADARPHSDCLMRLAAHLADPLVAAVAGRMLPDDAGTPAATFARLESAVHQRLTLTGAVRVGSVTPLLGSAYAVRRTVLAALGFDPTHRLEDIDLTMRLLARGYRLTFAPEAACAHRPPADSTALAAQRAAWSRGFHRIAATHWRDALVHAPSSLAAIDRLLFALGYLDRLSLSLAVLLAVLDATVWPALWMPWWVPVLYVAVPLAQVPLAMLLDRWTVGQMARAVPALALALLDPLTELAAAAADLFGRRQTWRSVPRAGEGVRRD